MAYIRCGSVSRRESTFDAPEKQAVIPEWQLEGLYVRCQISEFPHSVPNIHSHRGCGCKGRFTLGAPCLRPEKFLPLIGQQY